jgi:glycosyltransferase involved in cell wall biosynthesis
VRALLSAADGYVLASQHEGLPLVLLEAGATGLPVVTTTAGIEAMSPGRSGWVVPIRDPAALSERMGALMALRPEMRRAMGEQGRSFVSSRFALEPVLDTWEEIYTSALGSHAFRSHRIDQSA